MADNILTTDANGDNVSLATAEVDGAHQTIARALRGDGREIASEATDIFPIVPADGIQARIPDALLVLTAGALRIAGTGNTPVVLQVDSGMILPVRASRVYATGTTATVAGLTY